MGNLTNRFNIRPDVKLEDIQVIDPRVLIVLGHLVIFADKRGLPVDVTSLASNRENVKAVSRTHQEGRAIDVSVKGWQKNDIDECVEQIRNVAGHYGAIGFKSGEREVIIYHNYMGQGDHFHLQVSR